MPRPPRIHIPNAYYHVMLRGNAGQPIFFSDLDRCRLCFLIQEGIERFDHRIHAFCFMGNHIHLVIQTGKVGLSRIVQNFAFRYAAYLNKMKKRVGHIFQDRFKSILVDSDRYLRELVRYIHLNPVRAGLVKCPENYFWSGHRTYMGSDRISWLTTGRVLCDFGDSSQSHRKAYSDFIEEGIGLEEKSDFETGNEHGILGDGEFVEELIVPNILRTDEMEPSLDKLVSLICCRYEISLEVLIRGSSTARVSKIRTMMVLIALRELHVPLHAVGDFFKKDPSGLRKLALRFEKKGDGDAGFAAGN